MLTLDDLLTSSPGPLADVLRAQPLFQGSLNCSLLLWAEWDLGRRQRCTLLLEEEGRGKGEGEEGEGGEEGGKGEGGEGLGRVRGGA